MANRVVKMNELTHYTEYHDCPVFPSSDPKVPEADKSKSISEMSLEELRRMSGRLREEREVEEIIRSLRRSAGLKDSYENPAKIDTKTPIDQLYHWGILGQKWGVRRFQNKDGSLTSAGKRRKAAISKTDDTSQLKTRHPSKTSPKEQQEWAKQNDKHFSGKQLKAFTVVERMMLSDMGSNYEPKQAETALKLDDVHHPFMDDGFGNHYAIKDRSTTVHEYNHETQKYRDTNTPIGTFVRETYDRWHEDDEKVKHSGVEDELRHWGILGMKWGVRRFQNKDGSRTAAGKRREEEQEKSEDYVKTRESRKKGSAGLSNEELRRINERLRLEADYKNLTTEKIEKAESFVGKALKKAAGDALSEFAKSAMLGGAKLLVKEISPEFAEVAFSIKKPAAAAAASKPEAEKKKQQK